MQDSKQEELMNLMEYWNLLWRRKFLLSVFFILFVTMAMVISLLLPKYYQSETLIITSGSESGGLGSALSSMPFAGALGGAVGMQTPADKIMIIMKSRTIAETVIRKFDLVKVFNVKQWDTAKGSWKNPDTPPLMQDAVRQLNTDLSRFSKSKEGAITVCVEWKDPQLAADIANYYVYALTDFLKDKSMNITVQVVDKAVPAERKSRPKIKQNMMLAGAISLFLGIFIIFFLEYLSKQKK